MSLWGSIKNKVKKVAKAVSHAVHTATNVAADAVSDVVETIGNGIRDGFVKLGDLAGRIPYVGRVLGPVLRWAGRIIGAVTNLAGAVIKSAIDLVGGVIAGAVLILAGIITLQGGLILDGLKDIATSIVGAVLVSGGKLLALVQTVFWLERDRALTDVEKALLKRAFRESVALYNVRIADGFAGLYSLNPRPFTLGNTIYLKNHPSTLEPETLVHECTHVWQYQHEGAHYASDALGAQMFVEDEYNWEKELNRGKTEWQDFNKEAEAKLLEDIYTTGELLAAAAVLGAGNGVFYDADGARTTGRFVFNTTMYTDLANASVKYVRDPHTARLSGAWS